MRASGNRQSSEAGFSSHSSRVFSASRISCVAISPSSRRKENIKIDLLSSSIPPGEGGEDQMKSFPSYGMLCIVSDAGVRKSSVLRSGLFLALFTRLLRFQDLLRGHLPKLARIAEIALLAGLQVAHEGAEDRGLVRLLARLFPATDQPGQCDASSLGLHFAHGIRTSICEKSRDTWLRSREYRRAPSGNRQETPCCMIRCISALTPPKGDKKVHSARQETGDWGTIRHLIVVFVISCAPSRGVSIMGVDHLEHDPGTPPR